MEFSSRRRARDPRVFATDDRLARRAHHAAVPAPGRAQRARLGDQAQQYALWSWHRPAMTFVLGVARTGRVTTAAPTRTSGAGRARPGRQPAPPGPAVDDLSPDLGRRKLLVAARRPPPIAAPPAGQPPMMLTSSTCRRWPASSARGPVPRCGSALQNVAATTCDDSSFHGDGWTHDATCSFLIPGAHLATAFGPPRPWAASRRRARTFVDGARSKLALAATAQIGTKVLRLSERPDQVAVAGAHPGQRTSTTVTFSMGVAATAAPWPRPASSRTGSTRWTTAQFVALVRRASTHSPRRPSEHVSGTVRAGPEASEPTKSAACEGALTGWKGPERARAAGPRGARTGWRNPRASSKRLAREGASPERREPDRDVSRSPEGFDQRRHQLGGRRTSVDLRVHASTAGRRSASAVSAAVATSSAVDRAGSMNWARLGPLEQVGVDELVRLLREASCGTCGRAPRARAAASAVGDEVDGRHQPDWSRKVCTWTWSGSAPRPRRCARARPAPGDQRRDPLEDEPGTTRRSPPWSPGRRRRRGGHPSGAMCGNGVGLGRGALGAARSGAGDAPSTAPGGPVEDVQEPSPKAASTVGRATPWSAQTPSSSAQGRSTRASRPRRRVASSRPGPRPGRR